MAYVKKNKSITHNSSRGKFYGLIRNNQRGQPNTNSEMYHVLFMCCVRLGAKFKVKIELNLNSGAGQNDLATLTSFLYIIVSVLFPY